MAQKTKNNKKLTRDEKFMQKKAEITEKVFDILCDNKNYKKKFIDKTLRKYGRKLARLDLLQNHVYRPVVFFDIDNSKEDAPNGSLSYETKISGVSMIQLNIDRVSSIIKNTKNTQEKAVAITNFMQTVLHEVDHVYQHEVCKKSKKIKGFVPVDAYKYSLEFLAKDILGKEYYKKGENYWKMLFERNAREQGFSNSLDIMKVLAPGEKLKYFYTKDRMNSILNDVYLEPESLTDVNGKFVGRYTLNNRIAADAISNNPKLLNRYPMLKKAFNKDGSRKHLYQTIQESARAEKLIKLNPFLSKEKKAEKLKETNKLYSEIFVQSFDFVDKNEIDKTCKIAGKTAFNKMIDKVEVYEANELKDLVSNIKSEKMIREKFDMDQAYVDDIYYKRMSYARYVEKDNRESFEFLRNGIASNPHKKLSFSKAKEIINKDKQNVKKNLRAIYRSESKPTKKYVPSKVSEMKKTYSDYEFDGDLEEMRDLSEQYKELEKSKVQNRDKVRDEYDDLSKTINEKEKTNGIKE